MPVLTTAAIGKYKPQKARREIPDARAAGLYLVIQPSGSKSWAMRFRKPDGRPAKLVLGSIDLSYTETSDEPVLGAPLTLRQARQLAASIERERARGIDVIAERKAAKLRQRNAAATATADSFAVCAREFIIDHKTKRGQTRPRRWREIASVLGLRFPLHSDPAVTEPEVVEAGLVANWSNRPVAEVDSNDIYAAVNEARRHGSEGRARKLYAALSVLFSWLLKHRRVTSNPCVGVFRPGPPPSRERALSDDEIRWFWLATDRVSTPFGALCKLLLLSGCRLREVAQMARSELAGDIWTVPGSRTKNGRPLSLTLPPLAMQIIESAPRIGHIYVFSARGGRPVSNFSGLKKQLDAEMAKVAGKAVAQWRIHDLRRSFASGLAALGVQLPVIEKLLNHVSGSFGGIVSVYQKHEFAAEKAEALQRWAQHVSGLVNDTGNVAKLPKRGRR